MHTDLETALRGEIRAEMARQGVTIGALATATDRHPQTVSRTLSGDSPLTIRYAETVAASLGLPLSTLLGRAAAHAGDAA